MFEFSKEWCFNYLMNCFFLSVIVQIVTSSLIRSQNQKKFLFPHLQSQIRWPLIFLKCIFFFFTLCFITE